MWRSDFLTCFDPQADVDAWQAKPNPDNLYILVDDLEKYFRRLSAQPKARVLKPIDLQPWNAVSTAPILSVTSPVLFRPRRPSLAV
jgi:hypothetical protein